MSREALSKKIFHSPSGESCSLADVIVEIKKYILKNPDANYEIVIGSDSQTYTRGKALFATAVVVRRVGNGGVYFWARTEDTFHTLRDRIWKEAMLSITLAQEFRSLIKDALGEELFWEKKVEFRCIHLDVGEAGPTKAFIDGISGMVKGFGFEPVIKPHSYGAFVVADLHT